MDGSTRTAGSSITVGELVKRPKPTSQAGRILRLLEDAKGGKVSLPEILALRVSQYTARIHDLRHRYGFSIVNGSEPGRPDHTWFRLVADTKLVGPPPIRSMPTAASTTLFSPAELEHTARWVDEG
jgi:hypothetical protein